jgi:ABC-type polysaccharide/polyol phosphate transport system ATPase subunit
VSSIVLDNVTAEFPVYGAMPGLRSVLVTRTVGGLLRSPDAETKRPTVRALHDLSLTLRRGDQLGIVGHNGAGKSTLLRVIAGIYEPTKGKCTVEGRVSPLFLSAPGMHPDDSGYENIITCGLFLGMSREEIESKVEDINRFAELGDFLSLPVRTYSSGMAVRLGFAIATAIDPEILLLDEGLGASDERYAQRARQRVESLITRSSIMILASHSNDLIRSMCNRAILLDHGRLIADGPPDEILERHHEMMADGDAAEA